MDQKTDTSSDLSFTALSDVECDACTGRKRKAEQSCLQCLASYCESHLDMHNSLHVNAKRHKLVVATGGLRERVCTEHGNLLEVFCRTDRQCICHLCITDKHKGHDVILIDDEVAEERVGCFLFCFLTSRCLFFLFLKISSANMWLPVLFCILLLDRLSLGPRRRRLRTGLKPERAKCKN